ncbi:MAG: hypothetical protein HQL82_08195, partial [Magnetococcales bacterium]|nr:hypothetical protein [Magnetococcales bacterium]
TTTATTLSVSTLTDQSGFSFSSSGSSWISSTGSFTLSSPISFILHLIGTGAGTHAAFRSLTDPSGNSVDLSHLVCYSGETYCSMLIPYTSGQSVTNGTWSYQLKSSTNSPSAFTVRMTSRTGTTPTSTTLTLQPYMTGSSFSTATVSTALTRMATIAAQNDITLSIQSLIQVSGSQYGTINTSFNDSTTSSLVSMGGASTLNVFFVEDFSGSGSGSLGVSPGIPGAQGIAGNRNGVLISLTAHQISGSVDTNLMAETALHEAGHFLGLFHTTESAGTTFDPISDTPQCTTAQDTNSDGKVSATECQALDGTNLMFWQGTTSFSQSTLTTSQRAVLRTTPLAQ